MNDADSIDSDCDDLNPSISDQLSNPPPTFPIEPTRAQAIKFFITGVLFPISCLIHSFCGMNFGPFELWQSGEVGTYIQLLLRFPSILPFLPMMFYSMVCLTFWAFMPTARRFLAVRCGIYLGAVLSLLVFLIVWLVTLIAALFVGPALAGVVFIAMLAAKHFRQFSVGHLLLLTTIIALLSAAIRQSTEVQEVLLPLVRFIDGAIVVSAPTLTFLTYFRSSVALIGNPERSFNAFSILITWIVAVATWITSWKLSLTIMMSEYAKLPTTNPNCYVTSAAANGHSIVVRSKLVYVANEAPFRVNNQMRRLKFLELVLVCLAPSIHRFIRRFYDRVGPSLAHVVRKQPLLADVAYLSLVPIELMAELLRFVLRIPKDAVDRLY